jgi:hypothetical protein
MPKALSATIPDALEARTRAIAKAENRSLSNVVENALGVFTALPKELRDKLVERVAVGGHDDPVVRETARRILYDLAWRQFMNASEAIADSLRGKLTAEDIAFLDEDDLTIVEDEAFVK